MVETLTNPTNLLTIFVAVVCFATIVTIATPMMNRRGLEARLKSVSTRREELRRKSREALAGSRGQSSLRHVDEGLYKKVVERLQLSRLLEDPKVVEKLAQAGFRGPRPVSTFYFFRFILPFVFFIVVGGYLFLVNDFDLPPMTRFFFAVAAMTGGYYAPNVFITNVSQKRRDSIVGAWPDALDPADLRRERHVDRGRDPEGRPGDRRRLDRAGRGTDPADRRDIVPARAAVGL